MSSPAQPQPLHVVYYAGPTGSPYRLLRHLAGLARSASIEAGPTPARAQLPRALAWPRCDHVEAFPRERRGAKEALDRAVALVEQSRSASGRDPAP